MITHETHQFTVGSSAGCDLKITHSSVSRAHAKIYYSEESVLIEDLGSEEGTFIYYNDEFKRVKSAKIKLDTIVRLGTSLDGVKVKEFIESYLLIKEKNKKDISKRIKTIGMKRCFDCGTVMSKDKIHCECCGAIFEETA